MENTNNQAQIKNHDKNGTNDEKGEYNNKEVNRLTEAAEKTYKKKCEKMIKEIKKYARP